MKPQGNLLLVDCQLAGISGDMMIAALLNVGADEKRVVEAMRSVSRYVKGCRSVEVAVSHVRRQGFAALKVDVQVDEERAERSGPELVEAIRASAEAVNLEEAARLMAVGAAKAIVEAEAKMHGEDPQKVELHEIGSSDTAADLIGAAAALESLGFFEGFQCYTTPVTVGGGLFRFSHGLLQSPAPITLEILRSNGIPLVGGPVDMELATPTGAAILAGMKPTPASYYPAMKPLLVGYGAGAKELAGVPNILRIVLGESLRPALRDEVYVLETNLDDATGETVGYAVEKLIERGAKDVSLIPVLGKKGRPGQIVKVIADRAAVNELVRVLIAETGTLGVRLYPCERHIMARQTTPLQVRVAGVEAVVNMKVSKDPEGETILLKPEYEDLKTIAERTGIPLRAVAEEVMAKAKQTGLDRKSAVLE
ncbi:MAG: nickel pincer cofactor biosynthesis protein LarC [Candidatus Bathyarchaeia archaeon]